MDGQLQHPGRPPAPQQTRQHPKKTTSTSAEPPTPQQSHQHPSRCSSTPTDPLGSTSKELCLEEKRQQLGVIAGN